MLWLDDVPETCSRHAALLSFAESRGIDPSLASDVVAGVLEYCRSRHGSDRVSLPYLRFLVARAAASSGGVAGREASGTSSALTEAERQLTGALQASADPSALYDLFRTGVLMPVASNIAASGWALHLDLRIPVVTAASDHVLAWSKVADTLSLRVAEWRAGHPGIDLVRVTPGGPWLTGLDEVRLCLVERMERAAERAGQVRPMVLWVPTVPAKAARAR
ncbi:MAG TPA: hypothetical protein PKC67_07435 [Kiritimatiellia bacterium]|nr:hypothetical protein [Kiritimatiellia bacterium]HMP34170.1 hypothetical protein [Kiritimatiellia bacterium]